MSRRIALAQPLRLSAIVAILAALVVPAAAGNIGRTEPVGAPLAASDPHQVMQPVEAPARLFRIASVPGSPAKEAWAYGYSYSRKPGFDQAQVAGQSVMARYTSGSGWQVQGPLVDPDGRPMPSAQINAMSLAASGEGWAVGVGGSIFHREPGGRWTFDPAASSLTGNELFGISVRSDESGTFGYAVGTALTLLRLDSSGWRLDVVNSGLGSGGALPELHGVAAVDRTTAWAVGSGSYNDPYSSRMNNRLFALRRSAEGWTQVTTGRAMFDSPPAPVLTDDGSTTINQFAIANGVSADAGGAWIAGNMQPIDATKPTGEPGSDRSRPFALRFDHTGRLMTTYCPRIYQVNNAGLSSTIEVCDRPFPFTTGELPLISSFDDGTALAGGFGFFRFRDGRWTREPSTAGFIISGGFTNPGEGWVATPGNVFNRGGTASGISSTLGHWTTAPAEPRIRRWPHAGVEPLEAVAVDPSGSGSALAVGAQGAAARLDPGVGWDVLPTPTKQNLHGLAWPAAPGPAWAVGSKGTILRYQGSWTKVDNLPTDKDLYSVAIGPRGEGIAVGDKGVILTLREGAWTKDPASAITSVRLNAVAFAADEAIAVGDRGTILVRKSGRWEQVGGLEELLRSGQERAVANLLAVAGLPDGHAFVGGARSVLLERNALGGFSASDLPPLEGSIHALAAATRPDGSLILAASVGESNSRYSGHRIVEPRGMPFVGDASGWRDAGAMKPAGGSPDFDAPAQRDPVYGFALDRTGRGWAVGGMPADLPTSEGHLRVSPTSSIWRLSMTTMPEASPADVSATPSIGPGKVAFAFMGDSACASGLCGPVEGSGSRADVVLRQARAEIDQVAAEAGIRFLAFGGDMRRNGLPDELEPVEQLLRSLRIPAYAAIGDKDLFAGLGPSFGGQQGGAVPSAGYFLQTMADAPAPWGNGPLPPGIAAVDTPDGVTADPGMARTHYGFDVIDGGARLLRVLFLDTSSNTLAASATRQNPPRDQRAWLQSVLTQAQDARIPTIVVMHQPLVVPLSAAPDAPLLTGTLTAGGVSAVLASHDGLNRLTLSPSASSPDAFLAGAFSGAGGVLGGDWRFQNGAYHSWQLVTVDTDRRKLTALGRAKIEVRSMPILESVALNAPQGRTVNAGGTLGFNGLGRLPDVGGAHMQGVAADLNQSNATYITFPLPRVCDLLEDTASGCMDASAARPDHSFWCEDATVCAFVRADPSRPGHPLRDAGGRLLLDPASSTMCSFRPGTTHVRLESGTKAARVPVTVTAGSGPCIPGTFAPIEEASLPVISEQSTSTTPSIERDPARPLKPRLPEPAAVAALAPPIINPAPAPPGGGAAQREEEKQAATEKAEATALAVNVRRPADQALPMLAAMFGIAVAGVASVRGYRSRVNENMYALARINRNERG